MSEVFDIGIIGSGPAGHTAAIAASQAGAKVALFEREALGGICLHKGCIPTKTYLENLKAVKRAAEILESSGSLSVSLNALQVKKDKIVGNVRKGLEFLLKHHRIAFVHGQARVRNKTTIEVDKGIDVESFKVKHIIIATGSHPHKLPFLPIDGKKIITSDQLFSLTEIPGKVVIVGAGAIGCEFAQIFNQLGAAVFLVECMPSILPDIDEEISRVLEQSMVRDGIHVYTSIGLESFEQKNDQLIVRLQNKEQIETDMIVSAIGRRANIENLGLAETDVKITHQQIEVNEYLRTNVETISAIGDCVAGPMLAHKAAYDASIAIENILREKREKVDYSIVPNCIFTTPEVASVGMTQRDAESVAEIKIGKFPFAASGKAQITGEIRGFVKIIARKDDDRLLGCHICGPHATELISVCSVAIRNRLKASEVAAAVFAHPTLSEAVKEAAEDVNGRALNIAKKR